MKKYFKEMMAKAAQLALTYKKRAAVVFLAGLTATMFYLYPPSNAKKLFGKDSPPPVMEVTPAVDVPVADSPPPAPPVPGCTGDSVPVLGAAGEVVGCFSPPTLLPADRG